jgi:ABC-type transport system substrate-binding protein
MPKRVVSHALVALLLGVGACGAEDATDSSTTTSTSSAAITTTVALTDATTTTEPTTTTTAPTLARTTTLPEPQILRGDGFGPVSLGDGEDEAMTALVDAFGQPTSDIAHEGPFTEELRCFTALGISCFNYVRFVEWDTIGLSVIISDWVVSFDTESSEQVEAPSNLRGFTYTGGASQQTLQTAEGITIGSTLEDLSVAFGDDLLISEDPCTFDTEYGFTLRPGPTIITGLWGQLSRQPVEGVVESVGAGASTSNC